MASQVEVVGALATDVTFAYVLLVRLLVQGVLEACKLTYVESFGSLMAFTTVQPLASE